MGRLPLGPVLVCSMVETAKSAECPLLLRQVRTSVRSHHSTHRARDRFHGAHHLITAPHIADDSPRTASFLAVAEPVGVGREQGIGRDETGLPARRAHTTPGIVDGSRIAFLLADPGPTPKLQAQAPAHGWVGWRAGAHRTAGVPGL